MTGGAATAGLLALFDSIPDEQRRRALSHASWVERRVDSYGRLAFLGDSVLGLAIANELFNRHPEHDIGDLTKIHNQAVSGRACAEVGIELGIPELIADLAPDDDSAIDATTLLASERPLASLTESVIGACFLEHGFDATAAAVVAAFGDQIDAAERERIDFKSELQERLARSGVTVSYEVVAEQGPAHDRRFEVAASVNGEVAGTGSGRSKKEAEQAAAEEALEKVRR